MKDKISELESSIQGLDVVSKLAHIKSVYSNTVAFSTSLGLEDQIISHIIGKNQLNIRVFTLDTGRLFEETYNVLNITRIRYDLPIEIYHPEAKDIEELVYKKGPYSFYESVENRKECCYIRKVKPLQRALQGVKCWITGIRSEHSDARKGLTEVEWDSANQLIKIHPLVHWTLDEVNTFIQENNVPINNLHKKGFPSIGCAPCTRAVKPGEDVRAGRWWWEQESAKECGLHNNK